jgi:uncharacterized membrane protein YfcA
MELLTTLWWLVPLTTLSAILTATAGIGGGVILLGVLGLVLPPTAVVPVHGAMMLLQGAFRIGFLWRLVDWRFIKYAAIGSVVGVAIAGPVAVMIPPTQMQVILGLGLLFLVWAPPFKGIQVKVIPEKFRIVLLLILTSIVSTLIGAGAVLMNSVRKRAGNRSKEGMLADQSIVTTFIQTLKIMFFGMSGFAFGAYLPLLACMGFASFVGSWVGVKVLRKMSNIWFDHLFKLVVSIMAGILLVRAPGF